jgi:hypothetical protein
LSRYHFSLDGSSEATNINVRRLLRMVVAYITPVDRCVEAGTLCRDKLNLEKIVEYTCFICAWIRVQVSDDLVPQGQVPLRHAGPGDRGRGCTGQYLAHGV